MIIEDIHARNCAFHTHAIDYRGKEAVNGINYLTNILKENENLDVDQNKDNKEETNRRKFFKPLFMSTSDWTLDNAALEHCNSNMCAPNVSNAISIHNQLFSSIRKVYYSFVL